MSLGKLLATGRSLVGGAPDAGRYNISASNRLPKFGSAKNPFAQPAQDAASPASSERVNPAPVAQPVCLKETQRIPELADVPVGRAVSAPRASGGLKAGLQVASGVAHGVIAKGLQLAHGIKWGSGAQTAGALAAGVWGKLKLIWAKLTSFFRKPEPKSVFPRFGKPAAAVQTELSLDTVKVVRNNLEDSDLEIVTVETATGAEIAPTKPAAEPKRGPMPPALKKITERLLSVKD